MVPSVESLVDRVRAYHPEADAALIERAYTYSQWAHRNQKRRSGDPYFVHPVGVAGIIADLHLDTASVCAGLLWEQMGPRATFGFASVLAILTVFALWSAKCRSPAANFS